MKKRISRRCRECEYYKKAGSAKKGTFFKGFILLVELHGLLCVTMSYILAYMERTSIAEQLSSAVISEIIAPVVVLGATKTIENIFEKNILSFSTPVNTLEVENGGNVEQCTDNVEQCTDNVVHSEADPTISYIDDSFLDDYSNRF